LKRSDDPIGKIYSTNKMHALWKAKGNMNRCCKMVGAQTDAAAIDELRRRVSLSVRIRLSVWRSDLNSSRLIIVSKLRE
jgi:hypothetical protein